MNRFVKTFFAIAVAISSAQQTSMVIGQELSVKIDPRDTIVTVGESFTLNVVIDQATNLGSFQFDVIYSTRVVDADSAWLGNFLGSTGRSASPVGPVISNASDTGRVTIGGFSFGTGNGPNSSGILATIKLTSQDTGITIIGLRKLQVTDINGLAQDVVSINDGLVRVTGQILPVDPEKTIVEANPDSIPADGVSAANIIVKPRDSLGNNLGAGQTVSLTSTAGKLLDIVSDNGDGSYSQVLQSSTVPGIAVITARVNGMEMSQKPQVVFNPLTDVAVKIEPSDTTITVGDSFTIDVVVENVLNLGSFQFDIEYETHLIQADSAWLGSFLESTGRSCSAVGPVIDNANAVGKVTFGGFSFGTAKGPDGFGVLAVLSFAVKNSGSATLSLKKVQITDIDGQVAHLGSIENAIINAMPTAVNDPLNDNKPIPLDFSVSQNYPNPFNPTTMIQYQLAKPDWVTITIFNLRGQEIRTLVERYSTAGYFEVNWDGKDDLSSEAPLGIYLCRIQADGRIQVKKMIKQK